jgi:tetratricopeptide (TPR) repeat protein
VDGFGAGNSAPWRAGANENTVLTITHPATIEGHQVPAGSYGLFFTVNEDNTGEVVLSKDYKSWGSFWYDPKLDEMREKINLKEGPETEMLTYDFRDITRNSAELVLSWEKKQFPVKIEFAVDDIVMANAVQELKGPVGFTWQGYASAANYSLQNKADLEQGLKWADIAAGQDSSFMTLSLKAGFLNQMGNTSEGEKVMKDAIALATENELNQYGYQLLNQQQQDKAIGIFTLNTQRHPKSANVWDSLGEGYALKGDKKNAILNFKKALSLNPPPNVKANSEKYLKQLGAM